MTDVNFQSAGVKQGARFAEDCLLVLEHNGGLETVSPLRIPELGIEIDCHAYNDTTSVYIEFKGSVQGRQPGLIRTDTTKKAIVNGALLLGYVDIPYIIFTSHLPLPGSSSDHMLRRGLKLGYVTDVVCVNDPADLRRFFKNISHGSPEDGTLF
jgi:hypothetical protein